LMLTAKRLREVLHYNPETVIFTRLIATSPNTKIGQTVGHTNRTGYLYAMIDNQTYSVHRLAWLYETGNFPEHNIDHINGDKMDNRISNLRDVTRQINMQNERRARVTNKSGLQGAHFRKERNKWVAQLRVNGKAKRFGSFNTPEEAHEAYLKAKRLFHEGCTI
jgi:hypothetical protein